MKTFTSIVILLFFSACSSMYLVPAIEQSSAPKQSPQQTTVLDKNGNVIVRSGSNRDQRIGYYFDTQTGCCTLVTYSTGPGCVPPPFKTIDECMAAN